MILVLRSRFVVFVELFQFFLDDAADELLAGENSAVVGDFFEEIFVFIFDLVSLEAGELVEAQIEDGVGLPIGQRVLAHQVDLGVVAAFAADE